MAKYFIIATKKDSNSKVEEIQGYQITSQIDQSGMYYSKDSVFGTFQESDTFWAINPTDKKADQNGVECEIISENDQKFFRTVGNKTKKDNLLNLPDCL